MDKEVSAETLFYFNLHGSDHSGCCCYAFLRGLCFNLWSCWIYTVGLRLPSLGFPEGWKDAKESQTSMSDAGSSFGHCSLVLCSCSPRLHWCTEIHRDGYQYVQIFPRYVIFHLAFMHVRFNLQLKNSCKFEMTFKSECLHLSMTSQLCNQKRILWWRLHEHRTEDIIDQFQFIISRMDEK